MSNSGADEINVLRLKLHGRLVGYLVGFHDGRNVLRFANEYKSDADRPTFSLITDNPPRIPTLRKTAGTALVAHAETVPCPLQFVAGGVFKGVFAQGLKVHIDNEFLMFSYLGRDLPGALIAEQMDPEEVPDRLLVIHGKAKAVPFEKVTRENKFSLAGIQMKVSMKQQDGRYNISKEDALGDWIIKTPSTKHKDVPVNEFTAMTLASMAGVDVPEIKLVELDKLDNLPPINLPDEKLAFAIKRFDRNDGQRIHMEDFAQVLVKYPHEKYNAASYEQIAKILYGFSGDGLADVQQFARRLLVNILLANGDAHLKNWSLLYSDQVTPRLSPAYDIVTTRVYIDNEQQYALNLEKTKQWYDVTYANFEVWAHRSGVPWRAIKPHLAVCRTFRSKNVKLAGY